MANFLVLQEELGDRLQLDRNVTVYQNKLKRWINLAQDAISGRHDWTFLQERDMIQTIADKTAGTVTVTDGSAAVTGSGTAFAATDVGKFIQFSGEEDWYEILTYVSSTSITVKPNYGGTSSSTATYTLRTVFYSLDSDVNRILSVKQYNTPIKLTQIQAPTLDRAQPNIETTGAPTAYALFRLDPNGTVDFPSYAKQRQLQFFPSPNDTYNIEVRYIKHLSDLSDGADISTVPQQFHDVLLDLAEYYGSKYLNDPKQSQLLAQAEAGIKRMIQEDCSFGDYFPILQGDGDSGSRFIPFPPGNFEQPY